MRRGERPNSLAPAQPGVLQRGVASLGAIAHAIPLTFDVLFRTYGGTLPVPFLRALAWHESRMKAVDTHPGSGARGLLQIKDVVRLDYNERNKTAYQPADLDRPEVNIALAASLLRRIATSYAKNHPRTLAEDWTDPRYVKLVVLGWNRGYSEKAGVGFVVGKLEAEGWPAKSITAQSVVENAQRLGAAKSLYNEKAWRWAQVVVETYALEASRGVPGAPLRPVATGGSAWAWGLGVAAVVGLVVASRP